TLAGVRLLSDPSSNLRTFADRQLLREEGYNTAILGAYGHSFDDSTFYLAAVTGATTDAQRSHARDLFESPAFAGVAGSAFEAREAPEGTSLECAAPVHGLPAPGVCFWEKGNTVGMVETGPGGTSDDAAKAAAEAA